MTHEETSREFFTAKKCDRCANDLTIRTLSWFTDETICMECSIVESHIKSVLREAGYPEAKEACGYVPDVAKIKTVQAVAAKSAE